MIQRLIDVTRRIRLPGKRPRQRIVPGPMLNLGRRAFPSPPRSNAASDRSKAG